MRISMAGCAAILTLTIVGVSHGQTAKYDRAGGLNFLSGLLTETTGCAPSKSFTGKITKVESFPGDNSDGWEFTLAPTRGRAQKFQASLTHNEGGLLADFDEMLSKGRRVKVKARQCGSGGFWTAEEVSRQ